ncbi:MAG: PmoA family protein [Cyclobacteriaceae bacterium]|nr:PmoA family protein [Cyclobacteriaceae bacterium SS2]
MKFKFNAFGLVLLFVVVCSFTMLSCQTDNTVWEITKSEIGILIMEGADSVLYYQQAPKSFEGKFERSNYFHPLYGMKGGILTEDFPEDHLHHRGIFWSWHQVFIGDKPLGDPWDLTDFETDVASADANYTDKSCILHTEVNWKSPLWLDKNDDQKSFIKEYAKVEVFPKKDNYRIIDFEIELYALFDSVSIGGSENETGYGGFSWRIKLPENVKFEGQDGEVTPQSTAVEAGEWMNISGSLSDQSVQEGVVVVSHPTNPNHPQSWVLRRRRSMQNAQFPGSERVFIPKDQPLKLKYRVIVYSRSMNSEQIQQLAKF